MHLSCLTGLVASLLTCTTAHYMFTHTQEPRSNFFSFLPGKYGYGGFLTVFQILTGENWNEVMYDAMTRTHWLAFLYFVFVVMFGVFLVMNLFVAVLCDGFGFDPDAEAAIGGVSSTEEPGLKLYDPKTQLVAGVKVRHKKFGVGRVIRVHDSNNGSEDSPYSLLFDHHMDEDDPKFSFTELKMSAKSILAEQQIETLTSKHASDMLIADALAAQHELVRGSKEYETYLTCKMRELEFMDFLERPRALFTLKASNPIRRACHRVVTCPLFEWAILLMIT